LRYWILQNSPGQFSFQEKGKGVVERTDVRRKRSHLLRKNVKRETEMKRRKHRKPDKHGLGTVFMPCSDCLDNNLIGR